MTEVFLAWLLTKVTSPIVVTTKIRHLRGGQFRGFKIKFK
ncbi:MAG: hypothetical protein ACSW71_04200 [Methanobrevibacter sp.]